VYADALRGGVLQKFIDAGAMVNAPSCAACMGGHIGILGPGEVVKQLYNRPVKGQSLS